MNSDENYLHIIFYCDEREGIASEDEKKNRIKKYVIARSTRARAAEVRHATTSTHIRVHWTDDFIYEHDDDDGKDIASRYTVAGMQNSGQFRNEIHSNCAAVQMHTTQTIG